MTYLDKLEQEVQTLKKRELLWQELVQSYGYLVRKYQLGKTINKENHDEIQRLKNRLGIGNGVIPPS